MNYKVIQELECYDCEPLIHIREDDYGQKYYCHWLDIPHRYAMVPLSEDQYKNLHTLELKSLLQDSVVKYIFDYDKEEITLTPVNKFDEDGLPKEGITLNNKHV